jgi:hypothetical protein
VEGAKAPSFYSCGRSLAAPIATGRSGAPYAEAGGGAQLALGRIDSHDPSLHCKPRAKIVMSTETLELVHPGKHVEQIIISVRTRRPVSRRLSSRLLRCARNDAVNGCHCEERSDEAISLRQSKARESSVCSIPLAQRLHTGAPVLEMIPK